MATEPLMMSPGGIKAGPGPAWGTCPSNTRTLSYYHSRAQGPDNSLTRTVQNAQDPRKKGEILEENKFLLYLCNILANAFEVSN
jgi:hypothetical protein